MTSRHIVLCHPVRTAIGTYAGSLKDMAASDLGAVAVRETLKEQGCLQAATSPSCRPGLRMRSPRPISHD